MDLNIAQPNENGAGVDLRDLLIDAGRPSPYATAPDTLTDSDAPQAHGALYAHMDIPVHVDTTSTVTRMSIHRRYRRRMGIRMPTCTSTIVDDKSQSCLRT
jgi:hypothetical protein